MHGQNHIKSRFPLVGCQCIWFIDRVGECGGFHGRWVLRGCQRSCEGIYACSASIVFVGGSEGFLLVFMCVGCDRMGN